MAKASKGPAMSSKAMMAKEERRWRAESMVKDSMMSTPEYKKACHVAEKELAKAETNVKSALKKGGK